MDVVERADVISKDFAEKFTEKLQLNQEKNATTKIPRAAQADFVYLYKLATGQLGDKVQDPGHTAEVLRRMKGIARRYVEMRKK
jgi:DNA mismatch repair protein MSH6